MEQESEVELVRVTERWDKTACERARAPVQGWLDSPIVLEACVQSKLSGSPHVNWLIGLVERLRIGKTGRWLSLGCGSAGQEIFAAKFGLFASLVALEASAASLEEGHKAAAAQGVGNIKFGTVDFNHLELPVSAYDVVLMNMSLHHVRELKSVLSQVHRTLRPEGFFLVNEFIGPRQCQFTDPQLSLVRALLEALPTAWRRDSTTGRIKTEYVRLPVEHWNVADPSEAIRSDEIVTQIRRQFEIVERLDYGGTILNPLLEHIVQNFDAEDPKDVAVIRLLGKFEDILIRSGVIPSDFTVMALRRKHRSLAFVLRRLLGSFSVL